MSIATPPSQQISAIATATAAGTATFTFPMAPQGSVLSGTVSIPGAPILAQHSATLSGTVIGMWTGGNPWGPVEANPGQILQVTSTNLTPNASYTAVWIAGAWPVALAPGASPLALAQTELVAIQNFVIDLGIFTGNVVTVEDIPASTQCLVVAQTGPVYNVPAVVTVVGGQTGFSYTGKFAVNVESINSGGFVVPFYGLLDTTAIITTEYVSGAAVPTSVYASSQLLPEAIGIPTVQTVTTSGGGTQVAYRAFGPVVLDSFFWSAVATTGSPGNGVMELQYGASATVLLFAEFQQNPGPTGYDGNYDFKGTLLPFVNGGGFAINVVCPANYSVQTSLTLRDLGIG